MVMQTCLSRQINRFEAKPNPKYLFILESRENYLHVTGQCHQAFITSLDRDQS